MLREDRELLTDLSRACTHAPQFALQYMAGDLSIEGEEAYALQLIDLGERLLAMPSYAKDWCSTVSQRTS